MLKECRQVAQVKGEPRRRWFHDDYFDLLVWLDDRGRPIGFELIVDADQNPHALVLRPSGRLTYNVIDDGSTRFSPAISTMSRVLGACVAFPQDALLREFVARSGQMDPEIAGFVCGTIRGGSPGTGVPGLWG